VIPDSTIYLRSILVLAAAMLTGLGGYFVFSSRSSSLVARSAQLVTAFCLLLTALASYWNGFPTIYWILELALVLPCFIAFLNAWPFANRLAAAALSFRRWDLALVCASPLLLLLGYLQINAMTAIGEFDLTAKSLPFLEHEKAKEIAFTDQHRPIPLFELKPESKETFSIAGDQGLLVEGTSLPYRAVRLSEASGSSNCIGWIFVGGRYEMQCKDVDTILEDNGYHEVKTPHVGDLVIYRDEDRGVTHAGSVALLLNGEQPLIESKWGLQGVFLHLPEGSPFGTHWTYYRSSRPNKHLLVTSNSPAATEPSLESVP
jgi:hypothetical protein